MTFSMDPARISSLLSSYLLYPLDAVQLAHISTYIDLLQRWNARTNLTAIRNPDEIVTRHFGESLFAAQNLFPVRETGHSSIFRPEGTTSNAATSRTVGTPDAQPTPLDLLDLGSGAGFPGIPIHLWASHLRTTLIESQQKKVAFLREVIRALTLTNINVSPSRAEDFSTTANTVTLRAVEHFDQILPTAARLVAPRGRLALLIADSQLTRAQTIIPNFTWHPPVSLPDSDTRQLVIATAP
jgi:16S rRNA (guanine527-N7)-methyltransferase